MNYGTPGHPAPSATPAAAPNAPPAFAILRQAAEWFALLRSGSAGDADRRRWQAWLAAAPAHAEAWRRVEMVERQFGALPGAVAHEALSAPGRRRRDAARSLALLCVCAAAGGVGALLDTREARMALAAMGAQYRTGVGQTRQLTLADGTGIWLDTATAMDVEYTRSHRTLVLHSGEILVQSAPDSQTPARPLSVRTRDGRLRALGTRFTVRLDGGATALAVFEGAVEVAPAAPVAPSIARTRVVAAGSRLSFGADWIGALGASDESGAAWSRGLLTPDNMRLADFVAELGRYRHGYLGCAPEVADLRLVGVYPLADTDRVLHALSATLPVRVRRILPWWVTIEAAT